ncbi:MAG: insulinase family protein [Elusimicrobia bacterium]|nr:insulinase family protein [Elusimicrobiota bacterium]
MRKTGFLSAVVMAVAVCAQAQTWMPKVPEPLDAPLPADPMAVTIHRLPNGLTVYLSPYRQEPRVTAWIATRAGSRQDPADSTGMAHYLEHMLFKGSGALGTRDFAHEKPALDRISELYEKLFKTTDPAARKAIYKEIDGYNVQVSTYAIPNELAQAYRRLGFRGFNAFTSNERTVFICNFPSNRAEAWARLEADRFARPVFRLFQTEIETVYEENNRSSDNPERILNEALDKQFWKEHPYGRTVLGSIEHLKNPSLAKMYAYYDKNYIPNNMAIALSGDFDREEMLKLITKHFGAWKPKALPQAAAYPVVKPKGLERVEVKYESEEKVVVAWQTVPREHPDADALTVMDMLMSNSRTGIIDLDLVQAQKVKSASSYPEFLNEGGAWSMYAVPRKGQKLEEAEALLMGAVAKLKSGTFDQSDIDAVITNFEVGEKYKLENNDSRVGFMAESFLRYEPWPKTVAWLERLRRVSKADVLRAAEKYLGEDRVAAYRRQGKPTLPSMAKPEFTKLDIKPERQSRFFDEIVNLPAVPVEPRWVVKDRDYSLTELPAGRLYAAANPVNDLFSLTWRFDLGRRHERTLCSALQLLDLSGAGALSAEEFKKKLYALGTSLRTGCGEQESSLSLSGLEKNLWPSLQLMWEHFDSPRTASDTLKNMVEVAIGAHQDNKKNPGYIHHALSELAERGPESTVLLELSDAELRALKEDALQALARRLLDYKRRVSYVGSRPAGEIARLIDQGRRSYRQPPAYRQLRYLKPARNTVLFTHRDMLQSQIGMFAADEVYDPRHAVDYQFLASYLGGGMSSVIFQEVREARALAYAASGGYWGASRKGDENQVWGYLGTQADKTKEATELLRGLLLSPPLSGQRFAETAKGIEEGYRTNPIQFRSVPGAVIAWEELGFSQDPRPERFARALAYKLDDLALFAKRFAGRPMTVSILGNRERLGIDGVKKLGEFEEKTLEQIFPY